MMAALSALTACSSSDDAPPTEDAKVSTSACTIAGGRCAKNFPFVCAPGDEPATGTLEKVCGSEGSTSIPCCLPVKVDAAIDTADSSGDVIDALDGGTDAAAEAGDASGDSVEAGDASSGEGG